MQNSRRQFLKIAKAAELFEFSKVERCKRLANYFGKTAEEEEVDKDVSATARLVRRRPGVGNELLASVV